MELEIQTGKIMTVTTKTKEELIKKYLGGHRIPTSSIQSYADTGRISGSLFLEIKAMLDEYANQFKKEANQESINQEKIDFAVGFTKWTTGLTKEDLWNPEGLGYFTTEVLAQRYQKRLEI